MLCVCRMSTQAVCTRQANASMAVFEDDIGAIASNVSQVRAFLADATHGAVCKVGTRPRPPASVRWLGIASWQRQLKPSRSL